MPKTMTEPQKPQDAASTLTAADIIAWLKDHPDFLASHPDACDHLTPPTACAGKGVADFQHYMMRRLREDRNTVLEEAREIVETSRANMSNQARIHQAVLTLLEARTFEDFIHVLTLDFAALLDVDIVTLLVESDGDVVPHIHLEGVHAVRPGTVELLTAGNRAVLESGIAGLPEIYGGGAGLVSSQLLLRLFVAPGAPPALLAFGSRNPTLFAPGQGTEMIQFLGQVTERCFLRWLDLPL